jgi:hypothetical protein
MAKIHHYRHVSIPIVSIVVDHNMMLILPNENRMDDDHEHIEMNHIDSPSMMLMVSVEERNLSRMVIVDDEHHVLT